MSISFATLGKLSFIMFSNKFLASYSYSSSGKSRIQINDLDQKEGINIQPGQSEETRIQKNEESLGTSGTTLNIPTYES